MLYIFKKLELRTIHECFMISNNYNLSFGSFYRIALTRPMARGGKLLGKP